MFQDWGDFYFLVGSASAGLIGLLFVVATLTTNLEATSVNTGTNVYMTPTVFHLAVVLVLSGLALVPRIAPPAAGLGVAAAAAAGLAYAAAVCARLHRLNIPEPPHWSDFWRYGAAPTAIYLGLAATAAGLAGRLIYASTPRRSSARC